MFKVDFPFVHTVFKSTTYLIGVKPTGKWAEQLSFVSFEHFLPLSFIRFSKEKPRLSAGLFRVLGKEERPSRRDEVRGRKMTQAVGRAAQDDTGGSIVFFSYALICAIFSMTPL
jgi:hypothetical protein